MNECIKTFKFGDVFCLLRTPLRQTSLLDPPLVSEKIPAKYKFCLQSLTDKTFWPMPIFFIADNRCRYRCFCITRHYSAIFSSVCRPRKQMEWFHKLQMKERIVMKY